jgi:hypothetical protein
MQVCDSEGEGGNMSRGKWILWVIAADILLTVLMAATQFGWTI